MHPYNFRKGSGPHPVLTIAIFFINIFLAFGIFTPYLPAANETSANIFFPLRKGSYWIYQGQTKWTSPETSQVLEKNITWKMQVEDVMQRGHLVIAKVKGYPQDLAWYDEGKMPGDYLIVQADEKYYLIEGKKRVREVLSRLADQNDALVNLVQESELFLEKPLEKFQSFGETAQLTREDGFYHWVVDDENQTELDQLQGSPLLAGTHTQYHLTLRTLPEHIFVDFVPGVGITHYTYSHHGTVAEADLSLVEYSE